MASGIRVVGLRDLRRDLRRAGEHLEAELREANLEAAELVAEEARRRGPQSPHEGGPRGARFRPAVESIRAGAIKRAGYVAIGGAASPHAQVLEFGGAIPRRGVDKALVAKARAQHRSFASVGIAQRTRVQAQPYLYPAIEAEADDVVEAYGDLLEDLTRRAFPERR